MRHAGLNAASRAKRLAVYLDEADETYFNENIFPVIKAEYSLMQSNNHAPFYKDFVQMWMDIRNHKRSTGNIVFGDERAFLYPPLIAAHQERGNDGVIETFADMIRTYMVRENQWRKEHGTAHINTITEQVARIDQLDAESAKINSENIFEGMLRRLRDPFTKAAVRDDGIKAARSEALDAAQLAYSRFTTYRDYAYRDIAEADVKAFAANIDKLYPEVPEDYLAYRNGAKADVKAAYKPVL